MKVIKDNDGDLWEEGLDGYFLSRSAACGAIFREDIERLYGIAATYTLDPQ